MAQLSDDCFAFGGPLMQVDAALALLSERLVPVVAIESVGLTDALGRVLAEDVVAARNVPPHANSAVDGYAVQFADLVPGQPTRLAVAGRIAAGGALAAFEAGQALRVFTGAPLPPAVDTVLMQEDCRENDGVVEIPPGIRRGANYRQAGEDVNAGTTILARGRRIGPADFGLLASQGLSHVPAYRPLTVGLMSTGDELVEPGADTAPGRIYDANRHVLSALLSRLGARVRDHGIVRDRPEAVRAALAEAAAGADVVISSGGMSTGEEDHLKASVEALGGRLHAWRLAIKPGRPVALGQLGRTPFIGLPGNPVAVMVTFLMIARPLLLQLMGAAVSPPRSFPVRAGFAHRKKSERREYLRVRLAPGPDGTPTAELYPHEGAGILSSMAWADGLVEIAETANRTTPGDIVRYLPFSSFD